jgi:hypothetical protein
MLTVVLLLSVAVDSYAAWQPNGQAVCNASNDQRYPTTCPDGVGGAFIVWYDLRNGTDYDICIQRVDAAGNPYWVVDGLNICSAPGDQTYPAICSDGVGGAFITWYDHRGADYDVYAQRIDHAGNALWAPNLLLPWLPRLDPRRIRRDDHGLARQPQWQLQHLCAAARRGRERAVDPQRCIDRRV